MQNSLNGEIFNDADGVKSHLIQFFAGKNQKFYEHGIMTVWKMAKGHRRKRTIANWIKLYF